MDMCLRNKLYELLEEICICVKRILQTTRTKYLYVPNKLYELSEQICIHVDQILQTTRTKYLHIPNKLYELQEQNMHMSRTNSTNCLNKKIVSTE
jgi:protoporphyrinogen oxidase